jgi:hypothetical protein
VIATARSTTWSQSLARGALGQALLAIELAHTGKGSWSTVHDKLTIATRQPLIAGDTASLFFGAPAVTLHSAGPERYAGALAELDTAIVQLTHRRVDRANARMDRGTLPRLAEFDLIYGLAGIGSYLLRRAPHNDALERILTYLVRLTTPLTINGDSVPGWWAGHDPSFKSSAAFAGGHANFGAAHGIAGPLALLALAHRQGIVVDGHRDAIAKICDWLDTWRQENSSGTWWPQWITRGELQDGHPHQHSPPRPSWCYGTPGLARAQQLAGIATGDTARQRTAEDAMKNCLTAPHQLAQITDRSLCHGTAGLLHTTHRLASDAPPGSFTRFLPRLHHLLCAQPETRQDGLLEGRAGTDLALHAATTQGVPASTWDACLLLA